jgi:hypothetical protein
VTLSAFSLLSFAGRIAGIASRLPLARLPGLILHAFERASIEPALRDSKLTEDVGPRVRIPFAICGSAGANGALPRRGKPTSPSSDIPVLLAASNPNMDRQRYFNLKLSLVGRLGACYLFAVTDNW